MPVDDDKDGSLAREAVKGHLANFRMPDFMSEFKFRDDTLPYDPSFSSASFGPYNYLDQIPKDVAVYAISGWMDGAGYANGTLSRFLTLPNAQRRIMLGPWDHGARVNVSPWRGRIEPELPVLGEVLRFFDQHLAGRETGLAGRGAHPLLRHARRGMAGRRELAAGQGQPAILHRARSSTGQVAVRCRHRRRPTRPTSRSAAARRRATSASPASTPPPTTPTGRSASAGCSPSPPSRCRRRSRSPAIRWCRCGLPRASPMPRCSSISPRSRPTAPSRYVTEGLLRAIHRAEAPAPRNYRTTWPWRTFARKDAKPMPVGEPQLLRFALLPTAWRFAAGSRIRLSIAGGDADHFVQTPHGRPPLLTVMSGAEKATRLELPTDG